MVLGMLPTLKSVFAWPSSSPSPAEGAPCSLSQAFFLLCMRATIILGACYTVFLFWVAFAYPRSWLEYLQLSPLFVVAVTAPTLGVVMIRNG
ncbi:Os07g0167700 [Oryza sativa Japonica Group]|uniref:Os07g0167700 protein n=4 Tax=Oryza TaxID=4527 RepID=B9FVP7_ORYSJ|nr:hypothetical protein OsI_25037 [Oryza sativa Indica Group]EEE66634.1 hypothetical protein OsJ_23226 [Oryza sativa Japonica Group]KAB8104450.1 hypothetical protein EE612_037363 [Oryza sativa]BAD31774.1 unknown protein [Oryza sativa Japonica Group]BAF20895.1 Os07g0167700 [Oryza sativa Japonica Group]|eukprot:NP_001058981.1 Os07g0167700 [Oryza sativa Japonica Group]